MKGQIKNQFLYEGKKDGSEVRVDDIVVGNHFYRILDVRSPGNRKGVLTIEAVMNRGVVQPVITDALVMRGDGSYSGGEFLSSLGEWMTTHWNTVKAVMPEAERNKWLPNFDNPISKNHSEGLYLG